MHYVRVKPRKMALSPANAVDRTTTIHRRARPYADTGSADTGGHDGSRDRPRPQDHAWPGDATDGIFHILTVYDGVGLLCASGDETSRQPCHQQCREYDRSLHLGFLQSYGG